MDLQAQLNARRARLEAKRKEKERKKAEESQSKSPQVADIPQEVETTPKREKGKTWECIYCNHKCDESLMICILCGGMKDGTQSDEEPQASRKKMSEEERRKFEQKWLADSDSDDEDDSDDSDYEQQHGVRRPDVARYDMLIGNGGENMPRRRRLARSRVDSSDEEGPLVRPLNGDIAHLFNFYERKPPQDISTRRKLSTNFQIQLRKNQPRFKPILSTHEWQLLRNVDIDTDQPRTLIFTIGYSQERISKAIEGLLKCNDAIQAIAEFADTAATFRVLNQEGRNSRISFYDECTISIGNERVTSAKLERQPFVDMLFTNFPILCLCHPWQSIISVLLHCTHWSGSSEGIFPLDLKLPSHFDHLSHISRFEALARCSIRTTLQEMELNLPLKRSGAVKVLADVITRLEDVHQESIIQGLTKNKMVGRKAVVSEGVVNGLVKNENDLFDIILTIKSNPSWIAPTLQDAYKEHIIRREQAVKESFVSRPKRKRKASRSKKSKKQKF